MSREFKCGVVLQASITEREFADYVEKLGVACWAAISSKLALKPDGEIRVIFYVDGYDDVAEYLYTGRACDVR